MNINHKVSHISQIGKQHWELACGVASFAMLLQHAGDSQPYDDLCNELGVNRPPHEKGFAWGSEHLGSGVYFQDIVCWLQRRAYPFCGANIRTKQNFDYIEKLIEHAPLMIGVTWYHCGHWIILDGFKNGVFSVLDPARRDSVPRRRGIGINKLFEVWDGTFIALGSPQKRANPSINTDAAQ